MNDAVKLLVGYPLIGGFALTLINYLPFGPMLTLFFLLPVLALFPESTRDFMMETFAKAGEDVTSSSGLNLEYLTVEAWLFHFVIYTIAAFFLCFIIFLKRLLMSKLSPKKFDSPSQ